MATSYLYGNIAAVSGQIAERDRCRRQKIRKEKHESRRDITAVGGRISKGADG